MENVLFATEILSVNKSTNTELNNYLLFDMKQY